MAALILPGQYASWQNGLVHAVWQGRELSEFSVAGGFAKTITPSGEAIRLTGNQYLMRRLPAGFNFPLTFVSVFRRTVASPSRVLASVGSGTQRHLLYFASGNATAIYSAAGAASGQSAGNGVADVTGVHFAVGRVSSASSRDVFIDGAFSTPNTSTVSSTPQNVHAIGAYWNNDAAAGTFYSDADILFSGLWNRALSNAEILELYQSWQRLTRQSPSRIWSVTPVGGTASASGALSAVSLAAAQGAATGYASASAALASLSIVPASATASGGTAVPADASGSLAALTISAAQASASGSASASGGLSAVSLSAAQGVASGGASVPASASGSLSSIGLTAAQAIASGAVTAAGDMLGMNLTPAQAQAAAAAWVTAELRSLSVTPATATAGEPPAIWPASAARAIVPPASTIAIVPDVESTAIVPAAGIRAIAPATGDDMQPIKTVEQYKQDREVYEIDFAAKYLAQSNDTAATLKAVGSDPNISVTPEVSVGGALTSGVVKLAVDDPTAAGDYKVWAQITTTAGRERTGVIIVRVEDL